MAISRQKEAQSGDVLLFSNNFNGTIDSLTMVRRGGFLAVSSSPRPWMDVFASPEKSNMAVTESDPDPKVRKMSITF